MQSDFCRMKRPLPLINHCRSIRRRQVFPSSGLGYFVSVVYSQPQELRRRLRITVPMKCPVGSPLFRGKSTGKPLRRYGPTLAPEIAIRSTILFSSTVTLAVMFGHIFDDLYRAQATPYSAFFDLDRYSILSTSPELFFQLEKGVMTVRPMKGTAGRGKNFQRG